MNEWIGQNYEKKNKKIKQSFRELLKNRPEIEKEELKFSWSNWGFGREELYRTCARLCRNGIGYIELHGNHYGENLGYRKREILPILEEYGIKTAGVCGMFSPECELAAPSGIIRQNALDYIKREIEFTKEMGGEYLLIVPAAVGRPDRYDDAEEERSRESLLKIAGLFMENEVKGAVEPIRSAETSIVHTVDEALVYIRKLGHPGIRWINGDIFHMQSEEEHVGEAVIKAGHHLINLHLADSNRGTLGSGFTDLDNIIRALYLTDYSKTGGYVTPESLGAGGNPYPAMHGRPEESMLDKMEEDSVRYFKERERMVKIEAGKGSGEE